jgi:hypothetical protein
MASRTLRLLAPTLAAAIAIGIVANATAQTVLVSPSRGTGPISRQLHIANSGDTLYDLAQRYLGDEMMWPLLWSYNPQITNPHWIYPGDVVFLRPEGGNPASPFAGANGRIFPLGGFYTSGEVEVQGTLRYADTGRRLLAELDTVYLELANRDNVRVGDRFALNRVDGRLYDSEDELIGVKYIVTGSVVVTEFHEETNLVSAVITDMWDTIERGDPLFLSQPQLLSMTPVPSQVDAEGSIIDSLLPLTLLHEQHFIFLDIGTDDGIVPGNRVRIWERSDEGANFDASVAARGQETTTSRRERNADTRRRRDRDRPLTYAQIQELLPWQVAGEAMIVYATDEYATAVVTEGGDRELSLGQRITVQRGD